MTENLIPVNRPEKIQNVRQQKQDFKFLGSIKHVKGLTLFEYDQSSGELKEAEFKENKDFLVGSTPSRSVVAREGCGYIQALNLKNAVRKLKRKGFEQFIYKGEKIK